MPLLTYRNTLESHDILLQWERVPCENESDIA